MGLRKFSEKTACFGMAYIILIYRLKCKNNSVAKDNHCI